MVSSVVPNSLLTQSIDHLWGGVAERVVQAAGGQGDPRLYGPEKKLGRRASAPVVSGFQHICSKAMGFLLGESPLGSFLDISREEKGTPPESCSEQDRTVVYRGPLVAESRLNDLELD